MLTVKQIEHNPYKIFIDNIAITNIVEGSDNLGHIYTHKISRDNFSNMSKGTYSRQLQCCTRNLYYH